MSFEEEADNSVYPAPLAPDSPLSTSIGNRRRLLAFAALALTSAVAGGLGIARTAAADDGPASPETAEQAAFWKHEADSARGEQRLGELKTWIISQPGIETSGYIESVNNASTLSTILLWSGPANRMQQQIKDKARQLGITATVRQRKYSSAELDRAAMTLTGRSGQGAFGNFKINSVVGLDPDFDGVIVRGEYMQPPTGSRAEADAALAKAATAEIGVAVAIEPGGEMFPA
ncbi:hypothetical protein [Actinoplanes sp. NPDC049265]|uniref:hypothetical protein n=1 Tax=Actinoplanes sp. NPDC049265 TaxID=3363902 RepID=UPI00371849F4